MVYNRPASNEYSDREYLRIYGSIDKAKAHLFNVGAGAWSHPFWSNIDLPAQSEAFAKIQAPCIFHDLTSDDPLPISSGVADAIYTSHVVEHLPEEAVSRFMREAHRALGSNGVLRISTGPDSDTDWAAMLRGDANWWFWFQDQSWLDSIAHLPPMSVADAWLFSVATARSSYSKAPSDHKYAPGEIDRLVQRYREEPQLLLDIVTNGIVFDKNFPGNHISWWNAEKLTRHLHLAGFTKIVKSGYGQSAVPAMRDLRYFDQTYPQISVYVEAFKEPHS